MPTKLDPELPSADFIEALRSLMKEKAITSEDLSKELNLTIGTVRNWFYGNKDMPRKHKETIAQAIDGSHDEQLELMGVAFLSVCCETKLSTALWNSAAGLLEYDFTKASASVGYTKICAQWCTKAIMEKTKRILKRLSKEEVNTLNGRLMRQDRTMSMRNDSRMKMFRGVNILDACCGENAEANKLFIPVDIMEYKHYFVRIAASVGGKKHKQPQSFDKFIVDCLDDAATKAFNEELERICSQEE